MNNPDLLYFTIKKNNQMLRMHAQLLTHVRKQHTCANTDELRAIKGKV